MVLYCIQHTAGILRSIVHKFKYHPQEEAVFFVDTDAASLYCPKIDKITYYQAPDPWDIACHDAKSQEEEKRYTEEKISGFFSELNMEPQQFSHIYSMFDLFNPFILYFEMHSVKYMLVEFVNHHLSNHLRDDFLINSFKETRAYDQLMLSMHLQDGHGENCTKVFLYSDRSRYEPEPGQAIEVFGFYKTLENLDEEHKRQLIEGYDIAKYEFDAVMLFNSPLFTRGRLSTLRVPTPAKRTIQYSFGAACYFYNVLIDYYFSDIDFALKIHPESNEKFVSAFSRQKLLPREAPMELYLLLGRKFDIICPLKSASIQIFQEHDYNIKFFGANLAPFFRHIHFVFLSFTLINAIGVPEKILTHDIYVEQLDHFKNWAYKDFKDVEFDYLYGKKYANQNITTAEYIIAQPTDDFAEIIKDANDDCLIFINGTCRVDRRIFAKQEMLCSVIDLSDGSEEVIQQFNWIIMSKNKALLDSVKDFSASYTLENAEVMIQSAPRT